MSRLPVAAGKITSELSVMAEVCLEPSAHRSNHFHQYTALLWSYMLTILVEKLDSTTYDVCTA